MYRDGAYRRVTPDAKILLVEDDPITQASLLLQLKRLGYGAPATVRSGEEALDEVARHVYDVVVLDIVLAGRLDGVQTAHRLRHLASVPIIYLSGMDDEESVRRALETDPLGYLIKPPTPKELQIAIEMALYRHRMERQMREREARLNAILNTVTTGIVHQSHERGVDFINPAGEKILQMTEAELRGQPLERCLCLYTERERARISLGEALQRAPFHTRPFILETPQGQIRYIRLQRQDVSPLDRTEIVMITDVTARYESERRAALLAAAIENLEEGVLITERAGEAEDLRVIYANRALERQRGAARTTVVNHDLREVLGDELFAVFRLAVRAAWDKGQSVAFETEGFRRDGQPHVGQWTATPMMLREKANPCMAFIVRDITQIRRMEENMRQSQKLEAVGRLADGIAHDFNNIIAIITGLSELLIMHNPVESKNYRRAQQILESSQRGAQIISQLMAFSRRDKEVHAEIDLDQTVSALLPLIRHLLPGHITVGYTSSDEKLPLVPADKIQVEQVLFNLCTNARDAIGPKVGHIQIYLRTRQVTTEGAVALHPTPKAGDYVVIEVRDNGCGMSPALVKRIFEPFFTTKDVGKGTGLGLSTVYGIAEKHGGGLAVESTEGVGTSFFLYLPVRAAVAEGMPVPVSVVNKKAEVAPAPERGRAGSIWLPDDGQPLTRALAAALAVRGHRVSRQEFTGDWKVLRDTELAVLPVSEEEEAATAWREIAKNVGCRVAWLGEPAEGTLDEEALVLRPPMAVNHLVRQVEEIMALPRPDRIAV